ncbi:SCO2322 family protein [Streptomyces sp. NPDC046909]|uniref:SCO2322 family protein n=1 Tax=Streptomyces sp. NPDC046909 TaxID=3155617 RepID=UPI0033DF23C7
MTPRRAAALLLAAFLLAALAPASAQATGYRYWSFWDRTGTAWTYATQGPATAVPSDGDVQGFRFAVSADSADASTPRGTADFATICAKTPAPGSGSKRVALLIDFGTPSDAPNGETPPTARTACAVVAENATTAEALATVAKPLRYDTNALLCAIAGYPETGCGEQVAGGEKPTSTEERKKEKDSGGSGPSMGLFAGVAVVTVLGGAAVWQARRRRRDA